MPNFFNEFVAEMKQMHEYASKINDLEDALGSDVWEGFIGDLFNTLLEIKIIPYATLIQDEDLQDQAIEHLYSLLFTDPIEYLEEGCEKYASLYLKEYID